MPGDPVVFIRTVSVAAIPLLFAITLHEVAHGWTARHFGDRTAEMLGRLTLNPIRHMDPFGTVVLPLLSLWAGGFVFGWAKPVPVNARAMRNPRYNMIPVAAAGPAANVVMAIGWILLLRLVDGVTGLPEGVAEFISEMASIGFKFNILLAVFNLLPILPLDGGRILRALVPESLGRRLDVLQPYGLIIVIALLALRVLNPILGPLLVVVQELVLWVAGVKGNLG